MKSFQILEMDFTKCHKFLSSLLSTLMKKGGLSHCKFIHTYVIQAFMHRIVLSSLLCVIVVVVVVVAAAAAAAAVVVNANADIFPRSGSVG